MGELYIVSTPIGNLDDITLRAINTLKAADLVLCEDTRQSMKLLGHYGVKKPLVSFHQHSRLQKIDYVISLLRQGKKIALVSDAGTPGLSDPGGILVEKAYLALGKGLRIIPIPGPSALTAFISVSGLPSDRFIFLGFLPRKKGRQSLFKLIVESKYTVYFYESTHRIEKSLEVLARLIPDRQMVVGRELTKKFETVYRGICQSVLSELASGNKKGEFVVGVKGR